MHKHHIIPRHEWKERFGNLTGFNAVDNTVLLTIEQHAQCHKWLWEEYGRWQDEVAFKFLTNQITSAEAQKIMGRQVGLLNAGRKRVFTQEHIENLRHSMKFPKSSSHRLNISMAQQGKKLSQKHINNLKGRIVTADTRQKISESMKAYRQQRTVGV